MNRLPLLCVLLAFVALMAGGCKSQGAKTAEQQEPFIASYKAGMYQQALTQAEASYGSSEGSAKDRAAAMAGLSSYALRKPEQAEKWMIPLLPNKDQEVSGTANWTLGMISSDRGNHSRAATLGIAAAEKLKGDDSARARVLAGESYARLGRTADATAQFNLGYETATDPSLKESILAKAHSPTIAAGPVGATGMIAGSKVGTGVSPPTAPLPAAPAGQYVIQLGAYGIRTKAEQAASGAAGAASRAGQPTPRVFATTDPKSGAVLYAVQVGPYASRAAAEAALARMGVAGTVMLAHR